MLPPRHMWKMLHLIYRFGTPGLSIQQLVDVGLDCNPDTWGPLERDGIIVRTPDGSGFELAPVTGNLLTRFLVGSGEGRPFNMLVDYPRAFVVMPFGEAWSRDVYTRMIEPAVRGAGLECVRGDEVVRVGDLSSNVWSQILVAGVVIADVTAPNVNVYYELGLAHAIGRDVILLKQAGVALPADFGGAHYVEYDVRDLDAGRALLQAQVTGWAEEPRVRTAAVGALGRA